MAYSEVGTKPWDWWGNCSAEDRHQCAKCKKCKLKPAETSTTWSEEWPQLLEELMAEAKVLLKDPWPMLFPVSAYLHFSCDVFRFP